MNPNIHNEKPLQNNSIQLLKQIGYIYLSEEDSIKIRHNYLNQVVFKDILKKQLIKINSYQYKGNTYQFDLKNITRAIEDLDVPLNEGLMIANQRITDKILLGESYLEVLSDGKRASYTIKYIDFENPENNVFHVAEEFSVNRHITTESEKTRRPDLVLFINGIPMAVIELKKSSVSTEEGISQMIRNQGTGEIQSLFKYVQITLSGNNYDPRYGTTGTSAKHYALWNDESIDGTLTRLINNRIPTKLDNTLYSLFNPSRFLKLIQSFILFDKRVKKVARYPQYFAIKNIITKIQEISLIDSSRAGGLIWHTQGSGKSLTMVMLTKMLKRVIANSRVIVVTDRVDLDQQIKDTFSHSEINVVQASSGSDLVDKLHSGHSVITTLIHKFDTVLSENVQLLDNNIFVLVDESHRTQNGELHKAMKRVFPRACYIGFTGTPLLKSEKSSIIKFGGLLHSYTIDQAVKDQTVLPLLYEGRIVDQWITNHDALDKRFELISRNLSKDQQKDLKQKWARFSNVASSEQRLAMVAFDIYQHFMTNIKGTGFKAILATNKKYEAVKYHEIFSNYHEEIKTAFVISSLDSREGYDEVEAENKQYVQNAWNKVISQYGNEHDYMKSITSQFIDGDELDLIIVVDKLLTGFDAPRATVLYIDKALKEHTLLQAIARVNRLYTGKDYGLIIDYRGLLGNLDQALTDYSVLSGFNEDDIIHAVIDAKIEIIKVKTFYSSLEDLFKPVVNKNDSESYQVFLAESNIREEFYELLSRFARSLKLALTSDKTNEVVTDTEINSYKKMMKFYSELRRAVQIRYHEKVDFGKYEREMQKLLDTFISANEVNQLTKLVDIFDQEFDKEVERVVGDNARADSILSAIDRVISEKYEENPDFYKKLSDKIDEVIKAYKESRLSEEEKLKNAKDLKSKLFSQRYNEDKYYPPQIKDDLCGQSLYDNLEPIIKNISIDELVQLVVQINNMFKQVAKKPDWKNNFDVKNKIDQFIDDMLYEVEKRLNIKFNNPLEIIKTAYSIGINHYGK